MEKFIAEVSSVYFWLGVVLVGLIINLASAYVKQPIDRVFGKVNQTWKARAEKRWEHLRDFANALNDPDYLTYIRWLERTNASQRIVGTIYTIATGAGAMAVVHFNPRTGPSLLFYLFGVVLAVFSLWTMYLTMRTSGAMYHQQAAIKLHEDFRQIILQADKDDEAANKAG